MSTAYELLVKTLVDCDPVAQAEAARLLGEAKVEKAVAPLLEYVDKTQHFHKSAGFTALGRIGDVSACDKIYELMDDPRMRDDWYWFGWKSVRAAASHALLMLGDQRGLEYLTELADKNDDMFYAWFGPSILQLDHKTDEVDGLKKRITPDTLFDVSDKSTRLSDPSRLTAVIESLGYIGGNQSCERIKNYVDHRSRFVRGQAALSLMQSQCDGDCQSLVEKLYEKDQTDFVKAKAATALGDADKLEAVVSSATDVLAKAVAIEGLGLVKAENKVDMVAGLSDDGDAYVRQCVIEALERMQADQAETIANRAMNDDAINVRLQAAKCLIVCEGVKS